MKDVFTHLTAFPLALLKSVKQLVPSDFPVGSRLILAEWVPDGIDLEQALRFARLLDWIDVHHTGGRPAPYLAGRATSPPDRQVREAIERYHFGTVLVARKTARLWRTRLCHQIRQRVVALIDPSPEFRRMLVAVDMSDSTLLFLID